MEHLSDKQQEVVAKLRGRYNGVHPVLFQRMVERAKSEAELFDILDTLPGSFPLVWDVENRCLTRVMDILRRQS